jgi:transcriptional regulator with XRE-family HTH domain
MDAQSTRKLAALSRLEVYKERRRDLGPDVREALAHGASQAEVARASGLTRQWVAKLAERND